MPRVKVLWEAHMMRFEDAFNRHKAGRLTAEDAAELLGISARHFRRQCARFAAEGDDGLRDKRVGRVSGRRAPESELARMRRLYREEYADFTVKHFHEDLRKRHNYTLSYTVTRLALQASGDTKPARGRGQHRKKRARRPLAGMMLYQDGSTHRWIAALGHDLDLVVTMDDATSWIYSAVFVAEEGTMSSFLGLHETIAAHGLFGSLYTDRGSHYFFTPKAGGKVDSKQLTQVGRALKQLAIRHIPSYTPQGRGRMERVFGTLQQRLVPELRRAAVRDVEAANAWLRDTYIPAHNARFAREAAEPGSAFVPLGGIALSEVLCVQENRQVGRDNGVSWQGRALQIPEQRHRRHYVKATVSVRHYPDGGLAVFDGPRCLARYDALGTLIEHRESVDA
jgi:Helix-turn-helix domain